MLIWKKSKFTYADFAFCFWDLSDLNWVISQPELTRVEYERLTCKNHSLQFFFRKSCMFLQVNHST